MLWKSIAFSLTLQSPTESWVKSNFTKTLKEANYDIYRADYSVHNAETFDQYYIKGNGIDDGKILLVIV